MFLREYHPTRPLQEFIKSIIETKSKEEEDRIIKYTLTQLKTQITSNRPSNAKVAEYAIKSLYSEMLGQDASFSYVFLIKMIESKSLQVKKIGYLACSLVLHNSPDLKILLVQSLLKDISSQKKSNICEMITALNALTKLLCPSFASVFEEPLKKLLKHKNPYIKKKALIALQRVGQLTSLEGFSGLIKQILKDSNSPALLATCLNIIGEESLKKPEEYLPLLSQLGFLLKQIYEKKAGYYDYQKIPEPFMQIKILEIFRTLVDGDKQCSGDLYPLMEKTLMRADSVNTDMSFAVVYECILTICSLYPNKVLLKQASKAVSKFLSTHSNNSNLTYMGVKALRHLALKDPELIVDHQIFVIRCIESNDDSLKRITLELLYKNTNSNNINVIVNKLVQSLTTNHDLSFKQSLTEKVFDLAVRFSTSDEWFLKVVRVLILHASDCFTTQMLNTVLPIFQESYTENEQFGKKLINVFSKMLEDSDGQPSDILTRVFAWLVGHIGVNYVQAQLPQLKDSLRDYGQIADSASEVDLIDCNNNLVSTEAPSEIANEISQPVQTPAPVENNYDLLDLDFGNSEPSMGNPPQMHINNTGDNFDLLGDMDLLGEPSASNQPPTLPSPSENGLDLLNPEPEITNTNNNPEPNRDLKDVNELLRKMMDLSLGLFDWSHKSDLTKCWILDALSGLRELISETGGYQDFLKDFKGLLKKDLQHPDTEVRLRVRDVLAFEHIRFPRTGKSFCLKLNRTLCTIYIFFFGYNFI